MDTVGLKQPLRRLVITLRFDPLYFREQFTYPLLEHNHVSNHVKRLAVTFTFFNSGRVVH